MFTYLKPGIRERLISEGKLFRIDETGAQVDVTHALPQGQRVINCMPYPLPLARGEEHPTANWYAQFAVLNLPKLRT